MSDATPRGLAYASRLTAALAEHTTVLAIQCDRRWFEVDHWERTCGVEREVLAACAQADRPRRLVRILPYDVPVDDGVVARALFDDWLRVASIGALIPSQVTVTVYWTTTRSVGEDVVLVDEQCQPALDRWADHLMLPDDAGW